MMEDWTASIYGLFEPRPEIEYVNGRRCHTFKCSRKGCKQRIRRYLDTSDAVSTGNMRRHAKSCWGVEVVEQADALGNGEDAREAFVKKTMRDGDIKVLLERKRGSVVSYSHRQFTRDETRYVTVNSHCLACDTHACPRTELVRWCAENGRPFGIVKDRGFLKLMKTGRPGYWIPSPTTVARDAKTLFASTRQHIAKLLQASLLVIALHQFTDV